MSMFRKILFSVITIIALVMIVISGSLLYFYIKSTQPYYDESIAMNDNVPSMQRETLGVIDLPLPKNVGYEYTYTVPHDGNINIDIVIPDDFSVEGYHFFADKCDEEAIEEIKKLIVNDGMAKRHPDLYSKEVLFDEEGELTSKGIRELNYNRSEYSKKCHNKRIYGDAVWQILDEQKKVLVESSAEYFINNMHEELIAILPNLKKGTQLTITITPGNTGVEHTSSVNSFKQRIQFIPKKE